jgi:hypothetical protein
MRICVCSHTPYSQKGKIWDLEPLNNCLSSTQHVTHTHALQHGSYLEGWCWQGGAWDWGQWALRGVWCWGTSPQMQQQQQQRKYCWSRCCWKQTQLLRARPLRCPGEHSARPADPQRGQADLAAVYLRRKGHKREAKLIACF